MEKDTPPLPRTASESKHDCRFIGETVHDEARSLRLFSEKRNIDPDSGTGYEGTVDAVPGSIGDMWASQVEQLQEEAKNRPFSGSRVNAFSSQNNKSRSTLQWWDRLNAPRRKLLEGIYPGLAAKMADLRKRVA